MVYNRILVFLFVIIIPFYCFSQDIKCKVSEDSIISLIKSIKKAESDSAKFQLNDKIENILDSVLADPASFNYSFDSLKHFGKLVSPDKLFKIISWNIILADGTHIYKGIVQVNQPKTGKVILFKLNDRADDVDKREQSVLSAGKWFGALYYKILKNKINQNTYYTILGIRYNNLFTTSKVIEILFFDEFGNPVFGAPLFTDGKSNKLRVVFDYSANASMKLHYDEVRKMIIFDHLSASDPRFNGQYEYYGPDFSYDGYQFKNNQWKLITDLDIKPPTDNKAAPPKRIPGSNKIKR